jgi:hypothetical protein
LRKAMFLTLHGLLSLPEHYANRMRHRKIDFIPYNEAIEVVAWLRGEPSSRSIVEDTLRFMDVSGATLEGLLLEYGPLPVLPKDDSFQLVCNDGISVPFSLSYLRRRFHFVDDFLSEFPNEKSVELPFPSDLVLLCINHLEDESCTLAHAFDCLSFLNPKDPLYYFRFDTSETPTAKLLELYANVDEDRKREILMVRSNRGGLFSGPVPSNRLGVLAHLLEAHEDAEHLVELFPDCPSYLAVTLAILELETYSDVDKAHFAKIMLTSDFSRSMELGSINEENRKTLSNAVTDLLIRTTEWSDMKRLLTMCNVTYKEFGNEKRGVGEYVPAPYLERLRLRSYVATAEAVTQRIAEATGIAKDQVKTILRIKY